MKWTFSSVWAVALAMMLATQLAAQSGDDPRSAGTPIAPRGQTPVESQREPAPQPVKPRVDAATPAATSTQLPTPTPPESSPAPPPAPLAAVPRTPVAPAPARTQQYGATMPFLTYEAEAPSNVTNGLIQRMTSPPTSSTTNPEIEASGRAYVQLSATGHYLDIPRVRKATGMVLRHCIPDAPTGGGIEATLNVYVNGVFRQTITLGSRHNWLYGHQNNENGQSNNPADGPAHVFWDEARFVIQGGLNPGDTLRFQKDAANTAAYYRIDLVDLELIPPPMAPPKAGTYLSITSYGANGNDLSHDTTAINNCITAARQQGKTVWFPAGTYYQNSKFTLDGVKVRGAGPWHTMLWGNVPGTNFAGNVGFALTGNGASVSDMFISSTVYTNRSSIPGGRPFTGVYGVTENWSVRNVWMTRIHNGFWMSGADNGLVRDCRLYLTYADGININRGASHNLIVNNYVRGAGDDGIVSLSEVQNGSVVNQIATNNTFRYNTIIANWWGHNAAIGGGGGHVYEFNYLADNCRTGVLTINLPSSYPKNPLTSCVIRNNLLVRGGGNHASQKRGALWILPTYTTAVNVLVEDNIILDPVFRGIHVTGTQHQQIVFNRNVIERAGENPVRIDSSANGSGAFHNTTIRGLRSGFSAFSNQGGSDYAFTQTGTVIE